MPDRSDIPLYQAGCRRLGVRHNHIASVLDRIAGWGFGNEVDTKLGIAADEIRHQRREYPAGVAGGRMDAERSVGTGLNITRLGNELVEVFEQLQTVSERCLPASVSATPCGERLSKENPSVSSSSLMCLLTTEGVVRKSRAAWVKLRRSATRTNVLSLFKSLSVGIEDMFYPNSALV